MYNNPFIMPNSHTAILHTDLSVQKGHNPLIVLNIAKQGDYPGVYRLTLLSAD